MNRNSLKKIFICITIISLCAVITHQTFTTKTHTRRKTSDLNYGTIYPADADYSNETITISGNSSFVNYSTSGNGTESNPYIIENVRINASETDCAINISNTNAYFRLQNSVMINGQYGLYMENVSNGELIDNRGEKNGYGFVLISSFDIYMLDNVAINNTEDGFLLCDAHNNTIVSSYDFMDTFNIYNFRGKSTKNNNGINLVNSSDNGIYMQRIIENNAYGIILNESNNNIIKYSDILDNGDSSIQIDNSINNISKIWCDDQNISLPHRFKVTNLEYELNDDDNNEITAMQSSYILSVSNGTTVTIKWLESKYAENYTVYCLRGNIDENSDITSENNVIDETPNKNTEIFVNSCGNYTFLIVAYNDNGMQISGNFVFIEVFDASQNDNDGQTNDFLDFLVMFCVSTSFITAIIGICFKIYTRRKASRNSEPIHADF